MTAGACLFCEIVGGTEPGHLVLDEPEVVAFLDVHPVFKGHTLIVPRRHVETLPDVPAELLASGRTEGILLAPPARRVRGRSFRRRRAVANGAG